LASILGGLFLLLACLLVIAGLLYGAMLLVASWFFPGAWDDVTDTIIVWVIALVALFGLSRLSYAWATEPEPVPPFSRTKAARTDSIAEPTDDS